MSAGTPVGWTLLATLLICIVGALIVRAYQRERRGQQDGPAGQGTRHHKRDDVLTDLQRWRIARYAACEAASDYTKTRRQRANPYTRGSRAYSCYALEYGRAWFDIERKSANDQRA